ncbi:hypothetical protein DES40_0727 [Litorimonas taeanensis]|uniref:Helicase HerA central domain-containing protein n=1 Tax=Litorimonas taeanensis TaxID=568099 RepID=A0A420WK80_9PROT|nr:ATP-binding protein [Litorimonas taeanensis]RKQ71410.1 hypothetical protein DES40_0727 [Litorimonas taeanensis]
MSPSFSAGKITAKRAEYKPVELGRVLTVGSAAAVISINKSVIRNNLLHHTQIGTVLKILTTNSIVVAMVSSLKIGAVDEDGLNDGCLATLNILGEISTNPVTKETKFFRGVRTFPVLNEAVYNMSPKDLELIFNRENASCIDIGHLQQDESITAKVRTNDLLSKHFAIIGSTGSGKSCTVALVLQAILNESPQGHVVLFDPHNEYSKSFGNRAEVINSESLDLPLWMFDFVETVELLTSDIPNHATEEEDVLHEVILKAKRLFDRAQRNNDISSQVKLDDIEAELQRATHISLDSPVPYRIRDVLKIIDNEMGKLENSSNLGPYKRLKRRIMSIMSEPRYKFIFKNQASPRSIEDILGRIFRLPVRGKPISILDFSSIPSEALNIVVSVVSRLAFELATWSERKIPILLVCEEAHRYIPRDATQGFASTRRIISRIAKEGRKYGVSLAIVSQRPSELEPSTLSQCSTIFSMRLSNEVDQNFVKAAVPDGAAELLSFLPSLGTAEAMVFGEAVNLPMRVLLNRLPEAYLPHSSSAVFTDLWKRDTTTPAFMQTVFERWRNRSLETRKTNVVGFENVSPQSNSPAQNQSHSPAKGITPIMRQRILERSAPKSQTLGDVKSMINSAFNRDI